MELLLCARCGDKGSTCTFTSSPLMVAREALLSLPQFIHEATEAQRGEGVCFRALSDQAANGASLSSELVLLPAKLAWRPGWAGLGTLCHYPGRLRGLI